MSRRISTALLAIPLCLSTSLPVAAEGPYGVLVLESRHAEDEPLNDETYGAGLGVGVAYYDQLSEWFDEVPSHNGYIPAAIGRLYVRADPVTFRISMTPAGEVEHRAYNASLALEF